MYIYIHIYIYIYIYIYIKGGSIKYIIKFSQKEREGGSKERRVSVIFMLTNPF